MTEPAIACTLTESELREREAEILERFAAHVVRAAPLADGYRIELAPSDAAIASAAEVIRAERLCCRFLRFELSVEPECGAVTLALTGPEGTREFLARWLEPK
jgi:hypothetical protein